MFLKSLMKLAFSALMGIGLLAASPAPLQAAGTIPLALAIQLDTDGSVAADCQATFYRAGTVATKQNVYADFSLSQALSNPLSCDQSGRLPMFWLADGLIHVRLTNKSGNPIIDTTMQVLGPSSGGGGGGSTVDPTSIMATGDMKARYGTGPLAGFVRANGLTIGSASSGASERANADTQALFVYLCGTDANLVMTPPRSGNCLSDFNANKQLALPDWRGRALAFLDDMGNSAAGRLTATYFGMAATVLGAAGGSESRTLTAAQIPANIPFTDPGHAHNISIPRSTSTTFTGNNDQVYIGSSNSGVSGWISNSTTTGITINPGGGAAHATVSPMALATIYVKL